MPTRTLCFSSACVLQKCPVWKSWFMLLWCSDTVATTLIQSRDGRLQHSLMCTWENSYCVESMRFDMKSVGFSRLLDMRKKFVKSLCCHWKIVKENFLYKIPRRSNQCSWTGSVLRQTRPQTVLPALQHSQKRSKLSCHCLLFDCRRELALYLALAVSFKAGRTVISLASSEKNLLNIDTWLDTQTKLNKQTLLLPIVLAVSVTICTPSKKDALS